MSFNPNAPRHDMAAPGFSQAYDPFADLSRNAHDIDEALDFEDTYDGLGDQLDETDDAFNDDTFGDGPSDVTRAPVGKDFDFFGQTAKVANAMEEEHQRFSRQLPVPKAAQAAPIQYNTGYEYNPTPKPTRSGYEKYKDPEYASDLQVDASIWGVQPKKTAVTPVPAQSQHQAPPSSRKMMSLEEVEAAMRVQAKASVQDLQSQSLAQQLPPNPQAAPEPQVPFQHAHYPHHEPTDYRQQQFDNRHLQNFYPVEHNQPAQSVPHGHPIAILQRPSSKHAHPPASGPHAASPLPQQHQPPMGFPTQILQNPSRIPQDAARANVPAPPAHRAQNSYSRPPQIGANQSHLPHLSEQEKAIFLEAEARRAKRNHKIHVLSRDNGLMTPQDKSFITRIQLQQLVSATGDPSEHGTDAALAEDFYYQVLSSLRAGQRPNPNQPLNNFAQTYLFQTGTRHGGMRRQGRGPENHMQRMEQQVQRAVEAAKNKPKNKQLVIEGSLGKISFSNAKTPKPLLNIKRTESNTDTNRPSSSHRSDATTKKGADKKGTLRNIENVYLTLMKVEDMARNMPPPSDGTPDPQTAEQQAELQKQLADLKNQLWSELKVHDPIGATDVHPFIAFLSYPKGKKAIPRVFEHLTPEQRTTVLTLIVIHLDQLDVVRGAQVQTGEPISINAATRESIELFIVAVMPSLLKLLSESELHIITGVLGLITQNINVDLVARTRIGVSMLTMILSRAELAKQAGQATEQSWQQW